MEQNLFQSKPFQEMKHYLRSFTPRKDMLLEQECNFYKQNIINIMKRKTQLQCMNNYSLMNCNFKTRMKGESMLRWYISSKKMYFLGGTFIIILGANFLSFHLVF